MAREGAKDALRGIDWLGHAGFRITEGREVIYIDPYRAPPGPPANVILVTHDHFDHFSPDDVLRLTRSGTRLIAPPTVVEQLKGPAFSVTPGETVELDRFSISTVAAYNTNKRDSRGYPFHSRKAGGVGYVLNLRGRSIYHSGDTDVIPEMDDAAGVDVALLPVSGTYVMTATEAAEAARRIGPRVAVPMHWGTVIGSRADAEQFVRSAPVEAIILEQTNGGR